jgi:hypothetical protein
MERPSYVEFGGLGSVPGPLHCRDTTLHLFGLGADQARLDALCRRVFRDATGGAVDLRPLGPNVLLTIGAVGSIVPGLEPWASMGEVREPQAAVWIPVAWVQPRDGRLLATKLSVFCAAMWLDNPISLASGREVYGYPKTFGWPLLPPDGAPGPLGVDVFGMDFGAGQEPARRRLLDLEAIGDAPDDDLIAEDVLALGRWLRDALFADAPGADVVTGLRLALDLAHDLRDHRVDQIFLKQIRATDDGRLADLQQVVEGPAIIERVRARRSPHDFALTVHHLDSHPLGRELGLADQRVRLAARLELDFTIQPGRVAWDARRA